MVSLALAASFFIAIHLGVSGTTLRDRAVGTLGLRLYMVAFSVASLAGMAWLVTAYKAAPYIMTWGQLEWWKPAAIALMLPAFLLVVIGLTTPNPTAVAQEALVGRAPQGIVRVTRHPFLVGSTLWALVHLVGNGDAASLLLFGALAVVAAAGTVSIDAKRRRVLGAPAWDAFAARTSILPFAAIVSRRNDWMPRELADWRLGAGVLSLCADARRPRAHRGGVALPGMTAPHRRRNRLSLLRRRQAMNPGNAALLRHRLI